MRWKQAGNHRGAEKGRNDVPRHLEESKLLTEEKDMSLMPRPWAVFAMC